ncbi:hypothetical protein VW29_11300 [Devosia limi DSM 17137]|uniref:DUF1513 domain-containing protein n=1 Tax=Devosia limi DSM 17137 TaxID=1121477 RepID=A0A0F5LPI6_9HYPH|nr:DUF1513 domain-containing protein [Devosia limi]KKB84250.1 hypothetical protein VW29_11225 [Devosia limi DSM 17137]KKB84265.1 hypothetical protein VW29_11300 [Devosia limi DSM 17137]SHE81956.1 hypothetical protein SAMN02745223_01129 [Devosia limi DSM 17137]
MWQRRAFLKAAGAGFAASLLPRQALALERNELVFASAVQTRAGGYGAVLLGERGDVIASIDLPDRGHDITFSRAAGRGVVFARQPGTFAVVFDPAGQAAPITLTSPEGRHFYGHGVFSPDGKLLYATESDFEAAQGVIGVYDATGDYKRIAEYPTYGTGPHELLLMPDGKTLVIANGGIETHPDFGKAELNLQTMDPSVVFVDAGSGALVGQLRLEAGLHQLSIRHMAIDIRGRVWFGCQYKGAPSASPQLVGYATLDGDIQLVELPPDTLRDLRNYVGSVAVSADGETVAISSPGGNLLVAIDVAGGKPVLVETLRSGCGLAADNAGFVATSGLGDMIGLAGAERQARKFDFAFDNHMLRVG